MFSSIISYHLHARSSARRIGMSLLSALSTIYPMTTLFLFVLLCYASSFTFQFIQTEMKRRQSPVNDHEMLLMYKRLHIISCGTVDAVNNCFGFTLLLSTAFFFLTTINVTFYIFGRDNAITTPDIIFGSTALFHLSILCFSADYVRNKVISIFVWDLVKDRSITPSFYRPRTL